jgi:ABC-type uncharacterized transport system permease subunit
MAKEFSIRNIVGTLLLLIAYLMFYEGLSGFLKATFSGIKDTDLMLIGFGLLALVYFGFGKSPAILNPARK